MPLEDKTQKSELQSLLEKNTSEEGLTPEEYARAKELIMNPKYSDETCCVCGTSTPDDIDKAIYDTGLCQGHAGYVLTRRK